MKYETLKHFMSASLIYAFAAIITVKVNEYIEKKKEICTKNNKADKYCHMYIDPYLPNTIVFFSTFISTLILYLILYYIFGIIY